MKGNGRFFRIGILTICIPILVALSVSSDAISAMSCLSSRIIGAIEPQGVDQPSDVAIGPQGWVYLVDGVNNRVVVTDTNGLNQFAFGEAGVEQGHFRHPMGIGIAPSGQVYIADTGNHRIQVFDARGRFLHLFLVRRTAAEKPAAPVDVVVLARKNYVYISDKDNHKIKVHDQEGQFVFEWGGFGQSRGEFRYPAILAANKYNQILAVDVLNTRVQVFDPDGGYITEIGNWGVSQGRLYRPKGVAIDQMGRVFISDSFLNCIQVFSEQGGFRGVICQGTTKRELITPTGMAFDAENRLYAVEMRANRISILKVLH